LGKSEQISFVLALTALCRTRRNRMLRISRNQTGRRKYTETKVRG